MPALSTLFMTETEGPWFIPQLVVMSVLMPSIVNRRNISLLLEGGIVVRFLVIILHVPNGCPGETELMCVPVGVLTEHAVVK